MDIIPLFHYITLVALVLINISQILTILAFTATMFNEFYLTRNHRRYAQEVCIVAIVQASYTLE